MSTPARQQTDQADQDAQHLLFLADLFDRAALIILATKHLGHPITVAAALLDCLRGKLARGLITPGDVEAVPQILRWVGSEMMRTADPC